MTCEETKALMSEHVDAALDAQRADGVKGHLDSCPGCSRELELLCGVARLLRRLERKPLPAGFLARLEARRRAPAPDSWSFLAPRALAGACAVLMVAVVLFRASRPLPVSPRSSPAAPPAKVAQPPEPRVRSAPFRDTGEPLEKSAAPAETPLLPPPPPAKLAGEGAPAYARPAAFGNEAQAKKMKEESDALGIQAINPGREPENPEPFLGRRLGTREGRENAEANIQQLIAMRHAIEDAAGRQKPIPIAGQTAPVLYEKEKDDANGKALDEAAPPPASAWAGAFSGGNEGTRTVSDAKTFKALWRALAPAAPVPELDFSRQEVVAVFLGSRPSGGFSVEIVSAASDENGVLVRWREQTPPAGLPAPEGATTPYALRAIPKSDLPVRFQKIP
ncbi:MAG: protease complex subunit PrcB family protein [Elusimicrobia bacterium]|nr:protease complex subunit PrcB family protein [Elusimicrobiota bacterium]